ncbi:MAG: choice-of-anchor J domain-containing protein, partial [Ignavibacteriaceae bacterium]
MVHSVSTVRTTCLRKNSYSMMIIAFIAVFLFLGELVQAQVTTVWEKSSTLGTRPDWFGADTERGFAYGNVNSNDRIYVVSRKSASDIIILNAATGDSVSKLDNTGVTGGTFALNDVEVSSDGIIFASNMVTSSGASTPFKIYKWTSEAAVPEVAATIETGSYRLGDKITVTGSVSDNSIIIYAVVATNNKFIKFTTTDNGTTFTPEEVTITGLTSGNTPQIVPIGNGFWTNGGGQGLRQIDAANTIVGTVDLNVVQSNSNALKYFTSGGKDYIINYLNGNATTITGTTSFFERAFILDVTNGYANVQHVGVTPILGTNTNTNATGDVAFKNNGDGTFTVYVLSTNQGLGAYSIDPAELSSVLIPPTSPETFAEFWPPSNWRRYSGYLTDNSTLTSVATTWVPDDYANVTSPVNRSAKVNIYGTSLRHWLVTPTIDLGSGTTNYQVKFDIALTVWNNTNPTSLGPDDTLAVVVSTDNGVTWSNSNIIKLFTGSTPISNTGESVVANLNGFTGLVKIGFYAASTVSNADNDLFLDNVEVIELSLTTVDWCNLQWPPSGTVAQGENLTVYARAWIDGVTGIPGPTPDLLSWIGISSTDTDPATWTTWVPAVFNVDVGNDDEFMGDIGANLAPGTYYYASRFQYQSGPYSYGGLSGFWTPGQSGVLTVEEFVVTTFPYNEGFESTTFPPAGWVREDLNAGNTWQRSTAFPFSGFAHARYSYHGTIAADDWIFSPGLVLDAAKTYRITYNYRVQSATYPERMKIAIGNGQNAAGMDSVLFDHTSIINVTYLSNSVVFDVDVSGTYYIGFHAYSLADQFYLDLDDITISEVLDIDYAVISLFQVDGIPTPFNLEVINDLQDGKGVKEVETFKSNSSSSLASNVNNSKMMNVYGSGIYGNPIEAINPVSLSAIVQNVGLQSLGYDLEWSVAGIDGTPISRPAIVPDGIDTVVLVTTPLERGTVTSVATAVLTGDGDLTNNTKSYFRTLVYPDTMIRLKYDNGQNVQNTFIGFGTNNLPVTAGVRFTASEDMQLANIDALYRSELNSDSVLIRVWAAGTTTTAPG